MFHGAIATWWLFSYTLASFPSVVIDEKFGLELYGVFSSSLTRSISRFTQIQVSVANKIYTVLGLFRFSKSELLWRNKVMEWPFHLTKTSLHSFDGTALLTICSRREGELLITARISIYLKISWSKKIVLKGTLCFMKVGNEFYWQCQHVAKLPAPTKQGSGVCLVRLEI